MCWVPIFFCSRLRQVLVLLNGDTTKIRIRYLEARFLNGTHEGSNVPSFSFSVLVVFLILFKCHDFIWFHLNKPCFGTSFLGAKSLRILSPAHLFWAWACEHWSHTSTNLLETSWKLPDDSWMIIMAAMQKAYESKWCFFFFFFSNSGL